MREKERKKQRSRAIKTVRQREMAIKRERKKEKNKERKRVRRRIGRDCEIFKASQFVFGSRQRLPRPRRPRQNALRSISLSSSLLSTDSIYRRRISSREISRAISATDFYAAITPRFSFLFSTSCASSYNHSHIHLQQKRKVGSPRTANPLRAPYQPPPPARTYTVISELIRERRRTYARNQLE